MDIYVFKRPDGHVWSDYSRELATRDGSQIIRHIHTDSLEETKLLYWQETGRVQALVERKLKESGVDPDTLERPAKKSLFQRLKGVFSRS
jgi:hypothetical protein